MIADAALEAGVASVGPTLDIDCSCMNRAIIAIVACALSGLPAPGSGGAAGRTAMCASDARRVAVNPHAHCARGSASRSCAGLHSLLLFLLANPANPEAGRAPVGQALGLKGDAAGSGNMSCGSLELPAPGLRSPMFGTTADCISINFNRASMARRSAANLAGSTAPERFQRWGSCRKRCPPGARRGAACQACPFVPGLLVQVALALVAVGGRRAISWVPWANLHMVPRPQFPAKKSMQSLVFVGALASPAKGGCPTMGPLPVPNRSSPAECASRCCNAGTPPTWFIAGGADAKFAGASMLA
mmetsp:Transcript_52268/g.152169  ORF Transcript_52268/g.152169 Transcript_52268/m.152169 type:complete len:302 (-) Transcript_52268:63-968(-)